MPVISANTNARLEGYFRREWRLAVDRMHDMDDDVPFLFPIVIDDTPDAGARVLERFRERQWTRLRQGETPPAFAERIRKLLAGDAAPERDAAPVVPSRPRRRAGLRWWWIAPMFGMIMAMLLLLRERHPSSAVPEAAPAPAQVPTRW
jgi:hypothetical protein